MASKPLRIAVFHDLPSGGAKRTVHAQVAELVRRGHRVDVFATTNSEESFLPLRGVANSVVLVDVTEPPDREKTLAGRPSIADIARWFQVYRGIRRASQSVARMVNDGSYDVLLVHPSQFTQAPHVLRWADIPTVYYCHEVLRAAYEPLISTFTVRVAIRLTLGRIDRRNARAADAIAVNSRYTGQQTSAVYGRRGRVVAPAVNADTFRSSDARGNHLLAVGALHPLKGMDFIVDAVHRIPAPRPRLIIVADRSRERERQRIEQRAAQAGLEVQIRERVSDEELARLYGRARAVLVASHREPLGLVALEAMASGTPVVAVEEGGVAETVIDGETGYLVPREPTRFAAAIERLLSDSESAETMGRRGRKHVKEYWNWERSVDDLLELMAETVKRT